MHLYTCIVPVQGLEPWISRLEALRVIHYAIRALKGWGQARRSASPPLRKPRPPFNLLRVGIRSGGHSPSNGGSRGLSPLFSLLSWSWTSDLKISITITVFRSTTELWEGRGFLKPFWEKEVRWGDFILPFLFASTAFAVHCVCCPLRLLSTMYVLRCMCYDVCVLRCMCSTMYVFYDVCATMYVLYVPCNLQKKVNKKRLVSTS